jgi:Mce-associated membrane protein
VTTSDRDESTDLEDPAEQTESAAADTGTETFDAGVPPVARADVPPTPPVGRGQQVLAWCRQRRVAVGAVGLVVASAVAAGSVYWWLFRPDQLTGAQAQQQVVAAAKEGIEAALSYSPENLDNDLAAAKSHLTGQFLDYYSDFTAKVVTPAAKQKGVKTEANVARAAVSQMRPDKADVLVFVNQVTTSRDRPTPALATSTVLVTMVKSGGQWLIAEFNPV